MDAELARHTAEQDARRYVKAMMDNQTHVCVQIEKRYDLFGYPPQIVSIGLNAAARGLDHLAAIDEYLEGNDDSSAGNAGVPHVSKASAAPQQQGNGTEGKSHA